MGIATNTITFLPGVIPIVEICFVGPQNKRTLQAAALLINSYLLEKNLKTISLLVDLAHIGHFDLGAINESLFPATLIQYQLVAVFGQKGFVKEAARIIISSAGLFYKDRIMMFDNRENSLSWLIKSAETSNSAVLISH